jgi:hypothetical protein
MRPDCVQDEEGAVSMHIKRTDDEFSIALGKVELSRLRVCLIEAMDSLSRSEFFIRTGWAQGDVSRAIAEIDEVISGRVLEADVTIPDGDEETENPRYPRPRRPLM